MGLPWLVVLRGSQIRLCPSRPEVGVGRKRQAKITFPEFWTGPIWLQTHGPNPGATGRVDLDWYPWRRRQTLRSGAVLTTRRATTNAPPLRVTVPPRWFLTAGTGAPPTALDVNRGWHPSSVTAAVKLLNDGASGTRGPPARVLARTFGPRACL